MARGRDGLYRPENGILAFRYQDVAGIWREKYTGERDRKQARKLRDDFLANLEQGTLPTEIAEWRLAEAEKWWNEFRKPRIAENTRNSERYRLQHLQRVIGNKRLREITNKDLDDYTTKRLDEGIGAWSINKEILLWSLILKKSEALAPSFKGVPTAQNQGQRHRSGIVARAVAAPGGSCGQTQGLGGRILRLCARR
jgi:hypothetical protein